MKYDQITFCQQKNRHQRHTMELLVWKQPVEWPCDHHNLFIWAATKHSVLGHGELHVDLSSINCDQQMTIEYNGIGSLQS